MHLYSPGPPIGTHLEEFHVFIRANIGNICSNLTDRMYQEYSNCKLLPNELKAKFAWDIMKGCIDFVRVIKQFGRCADRQSRLATIVVIDESLRNSLEYLIKKYPPSRHKIADSELAKRITKVQKQTDI
jgi:hypothetical protein